MAGHRAADARTVHLTGEDGGQKEGQRTRDHWATRLIVQPNAFVSATGTGLPPMSASRAVRRSWLWMLAPLRSSSIRPW